MQTRNKILDDVSQLMTNAMGVAQGARDEAENAMKSMIDPLAGRPRFCHPRRIRRRAGDGAESP